MTDAGDQPVIWQGMADWYDGLLRAGSGLHELAVDTTLRLVPDLRQARVLDMACGQGLATRALAGAGAAEVTGIDLAAELIEAARRYEAGQPRGIHYLTGDAQTLNGLTDGYFDVVTCQLGLMGHPGLGGGTGAAAALQENLLVAGRWRYAGGLSASARSRRRQPPARWC